MECKVCGSNNITLLATVKTHHRGLLMWLVWIAASFFTGGLLLIIPLLTNKKVKSETTAICKDCGYQFTVRRITKNGAKKRKLKQGGISGANIPGATAAVVNNNTAL